MGPRFAPAWTAGCTADRLERSYGWHPGPCLLDSWSPSGCLRCFSWEHNDLRGGECKDKVSGKSQTPLFSPALDICGPINMSSRSIKCPQ